MSARKRFILFALSVCLITMLTSCKHGVTQDFNFVAGDTYIALTDDSYIFMIMDGGKTTYYRQYLYEDTLMRLSPVGDLPHCCGRRRAVPKAGRPPSLTPSSLSGSCLL